MDNSVFLKDCIRISGGTAHVEARLALWSSDRTRHIVAHMVVQDSLHGILDPSFEVALHPDVRYVSKIHEILEGESWPSTAATGLSKRELVNNFIELTKIARQINEHDEILVSDIVYYNDQADYVEQQFIM